MLAVSQVGPSMSAVSQVGPAMLAVQKRYFAAVDSRRRFSDSLTPLLPLASALPASIVTT